jgi:hypothetical protein
MIDENTEIVLTVRLPISCSLLTVLCDAVTTEHGDVYTKQFGEFLQFFRVLKGGE